MGILLSVFFCLKEACDLVEHSHHSFGVVFVIFLFLLCCVCCQSNNEVGFVWLEQWLCCKFSSLFLLSRTKGENLIRYNSIIWPRALNLSDCKQWWRNLYESGGTSACQRTWHFFDQM